MKDLGNISQHDILRVYSIKPEVLINWFITMKCNYDCWYCDSHDNTLKKDRFKSLIEYTEAIKYLGNKYKNEVRFTLTGGEPFLYKDWNYLINATEGFGYKMDIITNLSIPLSTLKSKFNEVLINNPCIKVSVHPQYALPYEILEKINYLHENKYLQVVKILQDIKLPKLTDEFIELFSKYNFPLQIVPLDNQTQTSVTIANKLLEKPDINRISKEHKSLRIQLKNEVEIEVSPLDLIYNNLVNFKGMKCAIGQDYLYIDYKGDAYPSACTLHLPETKLGNIYEQTINQLPKTKITCPFTACMCGMDLMIEKTK